MIVCGRLSPRSAGRKSVRSMYHMIRTLAAATGFNPARYTSRKVTINETQCNYAPITPAEEAYSYIVDSLLKVHACADKWLLWCDA